MSFTVPLPPRTQLYSRSCSNKHTRRQDVLISSDLLLLAGDVSCGAAAEGRAGAGAGPAAGRAAAGAGPAAGRVARCSGPAPVLAPFPVPGRSSLWTASCCWGGWLVLVRGGDACYVVGGGLKSGAALIDVPLDVGSLPPRSSSPTVAGCWLGGSPVERDRWG
jgi:hypothetical protein